jgi:TetR/AcrR family transcriptional regulator, lmrAB and yxaGH operons repressor
MAGDTRDRMIDATVTALQRHGVAGMSFTEVLASSGAARGAIYHHFPGGKAQLVAEAAARNGNDVRALLADLPAASPSAVVDAFLALVRPVVAASACGAGCAIAAVAVGVSPAAAAAAAAVDPAAGATPAAAEDATLLGVAAAAFASWDAQLAERLATAGLRASEASDLAAMLIALLEGAHVMCRAAGTLAPFEKAARAAALAVACR